jgi:hypothetical protein
VRGNNSKKKYSKSDQLKNYFESALDDFLGLEIKM